MGRLLFDEDSDLGAELALSIEARTTTLTFLLQAIQVMTLTVETGGTNIQFGLATESTGASLVLGQ